MQTGDWYYVTGEQQFGPVPFQVLQTLARSGDVSQTDLVWTDGMPDWVEASTMQELFGFAGSPTVRARGGRRGRGKSGGRPGSRRPNRAFGAPAAPAPAPVPQHAPPAGPLGVAQPRTMGTRGASVGPRYDQDERRPGLRRAAGVPGALICAALLNFLVVALTVFAASNFLETETFLRQQAESAETQAEIDFLWLQAEAASTSAVIGFVVAGVFAGMIFVLLTGQSWGPIAQTVVSGLASLPYIITLAQFESSGVADIPGSELVSLILILTIVFLLGPIGCVWTPGVHAWLKAKHGGGGGGRGRGARGGPSRGSGGARGGRRRF